MKKKIETLEKIIDDKWIDFEDMKRNERAQDDKIDNLQKDLLEKDRVINDIKSEIESIAKAIQTRLYALTGETPEPFPKDYNKSVTIH